jgi:hypothetical protein
MRSDETRFLFTARRVTVTEVSGYVEATDSDDAHRKLAENKGAIVVEHIGSIVDQRFEHIRISGPEAEDED